MTRLPLWRIRFLSVWLLFFFLPVGEAAPLPLRIQWATLDRTVGECSDPVWGCATFFMRYPVASDAIPVAGTVNRQVEEWMLSPWTPTGRRLASPESAGKSFFNSYRRYRAEHPERPQRWSVRREVSVVLSTLRFVSLRYEARGDAGERLQEDGVLLATFDVETGGRLSLGDLAAAEDADRLRTLAEKEFRAVRRIPPGGPLPPAFFPKTGTFALTENFLAGPEGLEFHYNRGEIAPPAEGQTTLRLRYDILRGVLRKNFPVPDAAR